MVLARWCRRMKWFYYGAPAFYLRRCFSNITVEPQQKSFQRVHKLFKFKFPAKYFTAKEASHWKMSKIYGIFEYKTCWLPFFLQSILSIIGWMKIEKCNVKVVADEDHFSNITTKIARNAFKICDLPPGQAQFKKIGFAMLPSIIVCKYNVLCCFLLKLVRKEEGTK